MPVDFQFGGFKNLNSTPIPDEFFDVLAVNLSEAELRVLLYIMRRTFGFKKKSDAISLSQLTGGIRKRDGDRLDHGTGLSRPAVLKAVNGLQAKGIITVDKRNGPDGRNEINVYQLRFMEENRPVIKDTISYLQSYSLNEYLEDEQSFSNASDKRNAAAYQPAASFRTEDRYAGSGLAAPRLEDNQERCPVETGRTVNDTLKNEESKAGKPRRDGRVKPVTYGGNSSLPPDSRELNKGKAGLPGGGKAGGSPG